MALWVHYFVNELSEMMEPWSAQDEWEDRAKEEREELAEIQRQGPAAPLSDQTRRPTYSTLPHNTVRPSSTRANARTYAVRSRYSAPCAFAMLS